MYIPTTDTVAYYSETDYVVVGRSGARYIRDSRRPNAVSDYAQVVDWAGLTDFELGRALIDFRRRSAAGNMHVDSNSDAFIAAHQAARDEKKRRWLDSQGHELAQERADAQPCPHLGQGCDHWTSEYALCCGEDHSDAQGCAYNRCQHNGGAL